MLEGPEDDSIRIGTCCPNTIINIIKFCCVSLMFHCIFNWQGLNAIIMTHPKEV